MQRKDEKRVNRCVRLIDTLLMLSFDGKSLSARWYSRLNLSLEYCLWQTSRLPSKNHQPYSSGLKLNFPSFWITTTEIRAYSLIQSPLANALTSENFRRLELQKSTWGALRLVLHNRLDAFRGGRLSSALNLSQFIVRTAVNGRSTHDSSGFISCGREQRTPTHRDERM